MGKKKPPIRVNLWLKTLEDFEKMPGFNILIAFLEIFNNLAKLLPYLPRKFANLLMRLAHILPN